MVKDSMSMATFWISLSDDRAARSTLSMYRWMIADPTLGYKRKLDTAFS